MNMQSPQKIVSAIPEEPADLDEFVKKLERQSERAHMTSSEAINIKLSTVVTTSGVKRPSDVPSTDSAPPKKPAVALRFNTHSFYAKNPELYTPQKQFPVDAKIQSRGRATVATDTTVMRPAQGPEAIAMVSVAVEDVHSAKSMQEGSLQAAVGTCGPRVPVIAAGTPPRVEFKLQRQAFEFFDQQKAPWSQRLRVFARELSGDGKRCFLVTTPAQLWVADVESAKPGSCHLYEIIREGMPCHLYFDLEFVPDLNPGVCGDSLVDLLVGLVAEELHGAFGIRMPLRRSLHQQQQQELREKLELCQKLEQPEQPEGAGLGAAAAGGQQRQEQVLARESGHAGNEVEAQGLWGGGAASLGDGYAGASEVERGPCGDFTAVPGCGGDVNRGSGSDSSVSTSDGSCPWVWELCSTTAAKFSRHLIIRIPHCAFKDNFHVNAFVRRLFDRIAADPIRFGAFFVRRSADPDDSPALFIDPAVYTRNRAFRLYLSSKAGKSAVLRATSRYAVASLLRRRGSVVQTGRVAPSAAIPMRSSNCNCALSRRDLVAAGMAADALEDFCAQVADISATAAVQLPDSAISGGQASVLLPPSVEKEISRDVFLSSLVTGVGRVDRVLKMYDVGSGHSDGAASLVGFHAAADLLSSGPSRAMSSLGIPRLPRPASGHGCATAAPAGCKGPCLAAGAGPHPLRSAAAAPFQYGPSPFPHIDKFIESVCCEGGVQGRVRCWQYLEDTATLLLSMRENRWCANIGRAHRSNGIYFTVDLRGGTWHQRCFDPECRDFRSARMPLPSHLWEECRSRVDERQHEEDEENEAHQPHQQAGPRGMQPTDDGAQESEQLRIPQKRLQDQSRGLALVTAGTHGGSSLCDEDDDPDFDMLCVQALERFERMVASNTTI